MKQILLTMVLAVVTLAGYARNEEVNPEALKSFNAEFNTAREVKWTVTENYYQAAFTWNDQYLFAYYNLNGELTAVTRFLSLPELPLNLQSPLKKSYKGYWISNLVEVAKDGESAYFITLENADNFLTLKSTGSSWEFYKKVKKS